MKHWLTFFISAILLAATTARAQETTGQVVKWQYSAEKKSDGEYVLHFKGDINKGWLLFSSSMSEDEPNTHITLDTAAAATLVSVQEKEAPASRKEPLFDNLEIRYFEGTVELLATVKLRPGADKVTGILSYMALKGEEVAGPEEVPFRFNVDASGNLVSAAAGLQESADAAQALKRSDIILDDPARNCGGIGHEGKKSLWGIFILGLLGGFIALLTPCVFPMIPLTVSFFTKKSGERSKGIMNASLYGFFIFLIYILLSLPFHFLTSLNPEILNNISTNVWLNLFFFVVFIVFAISFFGYFEITLPSGLASKVDAKTGVGGIVGIFFMALTLALVSFSCTGPILGSLLAGSLSTDGGAMQLTMGMAGFGLALALPFAIFALFPGWLNSLPRSGGWLTTVKVVLGFLEVAMAIKFLSNADLVMHWGILKREVFFAIWIIIGICIVLYLLGKIRFPHDAPLKKVSVPRLVIALVFLAFTLYLVPGVTNTKYANRALISGFPPPLTYSIYGEEAAKGKGVEPDVLNDYEKALALAREQNKPILVDFTGWACVNCRKMEENVWPKQEVKTLITEDYILVSLYVDDRQQLPEDAQFLFTTANGRKKEIKTIGDKFATMQTENFSNNSQPFYVLLSPDEKLLTRPVGYTPDAKAYANWLKCGLDAFEQLKN
ncbi:protein-disulfide reductase DsbD family protein [Chitinophaga japonensis]|uniref:Thiol:disulfide interchange protein DsbD n=1 Tax=Chitinophaga japonensis TaxID=104662 RepID=A0A562TB65_CHIJA|nr:thioredoxin family protein [Chitinophaga japonensis]TWI90829.1 thiol:disulfide interchange protein DsbD [Chitinophaga japonensis]